MDFTARSEIPMPPAMLRFRVSESLSASEFFRIGEGCASIVRNHAAQLGIDLEDALRVLDFGCGCGRTIRWLLSGGGAAEYFGVDVDADAIAWCNRYLHPARFSVNTSGPPLSYPDEFFDLIYCISVFTHLDESMQDAWIAELRRLLKPGGVLLLTIYGDAAIKDLDAAGRATLQNSGFVHRRSQKLKGLQPEWYHTSWHSREYILGRLANGFDDVAYHVIPDGLQDVVVGRRSENKEN